MLFEEIPVGARVKAEGTAYIILHEKKHIFYKGETDEIVIEEGENQIALLMKPYEEESENLIGNKARPNAIGDIVFSDGSATAYSADLTLTDEQKAAAIAIIFYAGSVSDSLGTRTLGIGIHNSSEESANSGLYDWASDGSVAKSLSSNVTELKSTFSDIMAYDVTEEPNEPYISYSYSGIHYLKGDLDGSNNWAFIRQKDSTGEYPAFEWAENYGIKYSLPDTYKTGWYMPTAAELMTLRTNLYDVNDESKIIDTILEMLNGTKLYSSEHGYHTANLTDDKDSANNQLISLYARFGSGTSIGGGVSISSEYVCAIRAF